jgi:hypothetical protein
MDMEQLIEYLLADQEQMPARKEAKMDANQAEIGIRIDENTKEMNAEMYANQVKVTNQEEMLAEICMYVCSREGPQTAPAPRPSLIYCACWLK